MAKATENKIKVSELIPDDKNFNKGSEFGNSLISKSFEKFGAGRSILIDKNNKIIAGNKSTENYGAGDGTIYRASGFQLTAVRPSKADLWELPDKLKKYNDGKDVAHRMSVQGKTCILGSWVLSNYGTNNVPLDKLQKEHGGRLLNGHQLRYIYLIDKTCKITVPILPFSMIDEMGAGMYKGEKITQAERHEKK